MDGREHDRYLASIREFRELFGILTEERGERRAMITGPDGNLDLGWVVFEREQMLAEVNRRRAERGLDALGYERIVKVELGATGHVDYAAKYAMGCAGLVLS